MCTPLATLPGENSRSEAILERLDQANLFVLALDDQVIGIATIIFSRFPVGPFSKEPIEALAILHRSARRTISCVKLLNMPFTLRIGIMQRLLSNSTVSP